MWQVDFYTVVERERERQRELERRHELEDAARPDRRPGGAPSRLRRGVARLRLLGRQALGPIAEVLDRPAVGPHHL